MVRAAVGRLRGLGVHAVVDEVVQAAKFALSSARKRKTTQKKIASASCLKTLTKTQFRGLAVDAVVCSVVSVSKWSHFAPKRCPDAKKRLKKIRDSLLLKNAYENADADASADAIEPKNALRQVSVALQKNLMSVSCAHEVVLPTLP